jgi:hypothetical protein
MLLKFDIFPLFFSNFDFIFNNPGWGADAWLVPPDFMSDMVNNRDRERGV